MDRRELILEAPVARAVLRLAIPVMLGSVLQTGYQLTDAYWVGRLGAAAVAAVAITLPITFLVIAIGSGFAMAGTTLAAQYMGADEQNKVNHVAAQALLTVAATSAVLGSAGYFLTPTLLGLMGVASDVREGAMGFMSISFLSIIFVFLYTMFQALMRAVGQTKIPLIIVSGTVALNFILDPLFIFGRGPIPAYGVTGAALATLLTQCLAAIIGLIVLMKGKHGLHLIWRNFFPDVTFIRRAFLMGLPASIEMATRGLAPMAISRLAVDFGTAAVAAFGIGSNITFFATIPALGLSMAAGTVVGQSIGAGKMDRAANAALVAGGLGGVVLGAAAIAAFFWATPIVTFFVPGAD